MSGLQKGARIIPVLFLAVAMLVGCAADPFVIEQVNAHLYRSPQPVTPAQWQQLRDKGVQVVVKLNDDAEGDESGAAAVGIAVVRLAVEPKGDGPIYAQLKGVFTKPDPGKVAIAVALSCNGSIVVDDHCTHGFDRTGFIIAMERVLCEGWSLEAAHEEWHRKAHYIPYGDRVPATGLEAAWQDFVDMMRAPAQAASGENAAARVLRAIDMDGTGP